MDSAYAVKGADFLEFMKMQVPTEEATSCIKKVVGGGTMGNWFENMEHMTHSQNCPAHSPHCPTHSRN